MSGSVLSIVLVLMWWPAWARPSGAPPQPSVESASLEELMNVEVASASRKEERLATTAASAFVITEDDIRRSGLNSVPEWLRPSGGRMGVARCEAGLDAGL